VADPARLGVANVFTKTQTWKHGADVASATALAVDIDGNWFDVTGTTTITSIKTKGVGTLIALQFDGILKLTHNASSLILPYAADIYTAAGDIVVLEEYASGSWRALSYTTLTGKGSDVASASDLDVQLAGVSFDITGTTQIDTIKTKGIGTFITLQFDDVLILAHDATNLDLGDGNITTAAGDVAVFWEYASADWRLVSYKRATNKPVTSSITLGTEKASTSGTAITFTEPPTGTKRIKIMGVGVSTSGTSPFVVRLGDASSIEATGYTGSHFGSGGTALSDTSGFELLPANVAAAVYDFKVVLDLEDSSDFTWVADTHIARASGSADARTGTGAKALTGELTRVSVTTVGGSDTFDAGVINISYE